MKGNELADKTAPLRGE